MIKKYFDDFGDCYRIIIDSDNDRFFIEYDGLSDECDFDEDAIRLPAENQWMSKNEFIKKSKEIMTDAELAEVMKPRPVVIHEPVPPVKRIHNYNHLARPRRK